MVGRWRMAPQQCCQPTFPGRQGLGPALAAAWQSYIHPALPAYSLEFSSSPGQKRAELCPLSSPSTHIQSPPPAALPLPVCSHKTCPAHSQALRPAEGINPVVPCAPTWGSSWALGSCQGAKKETALCWHWPPRSFGSRDLGVSWGGGCVRGVHSRKDSRMLPSWGSPRAV